MATRSSKRTGIFPRKRHHTERFRTETTFPERWSNAKLAYAGFLYGAGKNFVQISQILNDGTVPQTIGALVKRRWMLPKTKRGRVIALTAYGEKLLEKQAAKLAITPEELLERICDCVIRDRLYEAVTDGRYDEKQPVSAA